MARKDALLSKKLTADVATDGRAGGLHAADESRQQQTQAARGQPVLNRQAADLEQPTSAAGRSNPQQQQSAPAASPATAATVTAGPSTAAGSSTLDDGLSQSERATVDLFRESTPSVVNIMHIRAMQNFYTLDVHRMPYGQGSGFFWDRQGHVVTNYHVIKGASEVKVTLSDHTTYTARVVGFDAAKDIAVLKLAMPKHKAEQQRPVPMGKSADLRVGQDVFAMGCPFGLDCTMSKGIVSGLGREMSAGMFPIKNVIQVDAAINASNSGGVLLDSSGRLVGINVGITDPSNKGAFSGVGFAVPLDTFKGLVQQILTYGRVLRPALGITIAPGQVLQRSGTEGVLVLEVPVGGPAQQAGIRPTYRDVFGDIVLGDVIVGLDGRPVGGYEDLYTILDDRRSGDVVRVDVYREGRRVGISLSLGERVLGSIEE